MVPATPAASTASFAKNWVIRFTKDFFTAASVTCIMVACAAVSAAPTAAPPPPVVKVAIILTVQVRPMRPTCVFQSVIS